VILSSLSDYGKADFVIIGSPQDEGVRRNKGRTGARKAPKYIRNEFYNFSAINHLSWKKILDLGDIRFSNTLEETHHIQYQLIYHLIADGKRVIILGGGNDISYPDVKALHKYNSEYLAFNIDSHLDVRDNESRNSGTPYRQLLEEGYLNPKTFYEMAVKPILNADKHLDYLKKMKVNITTLSDLRGQGIDKVFTTILNKNKQDSIFWGIDMDSVRSADAPGVSASYPVGLTAEEICYIAEIAGSDSKSRILEITEVNPDYDTDNKTSRLAVLVTMHFINSFNNSQSK
jgi:formimidoylglutamase